MIEWSIVDTWIVIDIIIVAVSSVFVGTHLVLRKESLLGDGISHSVLPGIALGYILTNSRDSVFMFVGAIVMGILTAVISDYIAEHRRIDEAASLGVVFSGLFALGLLMISTVASDVDLDPSCVLFGAVELTPLDTIAIAGVYVPRAVISNGSILIINALALLVLHRKLNVSVFDPLFAQTIGIRVKQLRYFHIILVAITTVAAFESVGSILIVSLLVVPQAIGLLLSRSLKGVIIYGGIIAVISSVVGHFMAIAIPPLWGYPDTNTAGAVSVVMGILLLLVVFFAPQNGIIIKQLHTLYIQILISKDDIIKALYKTHGTHLSTSNIKDLVQQSLLTGRTNILAIFLAKWYLLFSKKICHKNNKYICTAQGLVLATKVEDKHRMWEDYLYKQVDMTPDTVHSKAEQLEHIRQQELLRTLKEQASPNTEIPGHKHIR